MNKILTIMIKAIVIVGIFAIGILVYKNIASKEPADAQIKIDYVDEKVDALITNETYVNADLQERKELAFTMLKELQKDKYIKHLSYDEKNFLFSFRYADNSLGGVRIKDLNSKIGDIPIN